MQWKTIATDMVIGGVAGVADQFVQNEDDKRRAARKAGGLAFPIMSEFGTYLNYGVPLVTIIAGAAGYLRGENLTKACVIGGQMAGRKGMYSFTHKKGSTLPGAVTRQPNGYEPWEAVGRARGYNVIGTSTPGAILV
jgi:hypothetical protein